MTLFWTLILCTTCISVDGYIRSISKPIQISASGYSSTANDAGSFATCPTSQPTVLSCELISGAHQIDGSFLSSDRTCAAQNGNGNSNGVRAIASCLGNDFTCSYPTGSRSGSSDDAISTVSCSSGQVMVACTAFSPWHSIDGSWIGTKSASTIITSNTPCYAQNDGTGDGVYAHGICCEYNVNNGYSLDCKTKWSSAVSNGWATVQCDSGYTIIGCTGGSSYKETLAGYYRNYANNDCRAQSVSSKSVYAVATCCRLYKAPTPLPTHAPSPSPTPAPTDGPTLSPTYSPTSSPTCHLYGECASVSAHCDHILTVYYAANGIDFVQVEYNSDWRIETRLFFEDININSVLQFECSSDSETNGGFIASILYKNVIYSTTNPMDVGGFAVVSSTDHVLFPLVYSAKTSAPWYITTENIGHNAYWIWNGGTGNSMVFEWKFESVITLHPTLNPTYFPTDDPSKSPTTPSPSKPGTLLCGDTESGDYNDEAIDFPVRMSFFGDLTFDASNSDFNISSISAVFGSLTLGSDTDNDGIVTLYNLRHIGDYIFTIRAPHAVYGKFHVRILCTSDKPTTSPTKHPSTNPTMNPTVNPTIDPTHDPTVAPSSAPSRSPSAAPSRSPHERLVANPPTPLPSNTPIEKVTTAYYTTLDINDGESNGEKTGSKAQDSLYRIYFWVAVGVIALLCIGCLLYIAVRRKRKKEQLRRRQAIESNAMPDIAVVNPNVTNKADTKRRQVQLASLVPGMMRSKMVKTKGKDGNNYSSLEEIGEGEHDDLYQVPSAQNVTKRSSKDSKMEEPILPELPPDVATSGKLEVSDASSSDSELINDKLYDKSARKRTEGAE